MMNEMIATERQETNTSDFMRGTYSPDDNKLRIYSEIRLETELYNRLKEAGFRYAPAQKLFVAPMWTPQRADLVIELCGDIEDEDKSLIERAQERAERCENNREARKNDADQAYSNVRSISSHIPLGQPILIGHHSERRHRGDLKRIDNGMRKCSENWDKAKFWEERAKDVIHHAKWKTESVKTRINRIKKLESELRKFTKWQDEKPSELRQRWINHNQFRIAYEKSLLQAQGKEMPTRKKPISTPIINIKTDNCVEMTKAEWTNRSFGRVTRISESSDFGAYRKRVTYNRNHETLNVFITDQKVIEPPMK